MEISVRILGSVDVLDISGPLSGDAHAHLRSSFAEAMERGRRRLVLNLTDAALLDSMMLGELVACFKRARERGGDVKLVVVPGGIVHELLQLAGLDRVFQIFSDEREAAASYTS